MSQRSPDPDPDRRSRFRDSSDAPHPAQDGDQTIRFTLWWKHPGKPDSSAVSETYEKITDNPEAWSRAILQWFNDGLRPHETAREFVRCEVAGEVPPAEHKWIKKTAMTQQRPVGGPFDGMICDRCGITGKRFNLNHSVKIDSKFKLKVFQRCDTSCAARGVALRQPGRGTADAAQR